MVAAIVYTLSSLLVILLLTLKQKAYWKENFIVTLTLKRDILICIVCFALAYTSLELHKAKASNHQEFAIGSLEQVSIDEINIIDRGLAGRWDIAAKDSSKIFKNIAIYILPVSLLFFIGTIKRRLVLLFVYTQGYILTESLTGIAKGLVDRYRPFAYRSIEDVQSLGAKAQEKFLEDIVEYDILNSFFSGDASILAFGFVFFALSYNLFYKKAVNKKLIWAIAIAATVLGCYFRSLSGKHFPTDVLLGAMVGSAVAYLIIKLHSNTSSTIELKD